MITLNGITFYTCEDFGVDVTDDDSADLATVPTATEEDDSLMAEHHANDISYLDTTAAFIDWSYNFDT